MYSSHGATRDMVASQPPILVAQFGLVLLTAIREFFFHGRIPGGHVERSPRNRKEERTQWLAGVMRRSLGPVDPQECRHKVSQHSSSLACCKT